MDLLEIKAYLDANKDTPEVKDYIGGFVTPDRVSGFLEGEEGKRILQPKLDTYHSKGLKSWQENNLQSLIDAKVKELHPEADPKDQAMNELKAELAQMKAEGLRKELANKALKIAQEKKLPLELVDFLIGADEVVTTANLTALEKVFKSHVELLVAERLKGGYVPPSGGGVPPGTKNPWKSETFNLTEQGKIFKENPTLAAQLMAQAK